ncbi:MAG: phage portal protein, partial [Nocardioidaceae bacterium]
MAIVSSGQLVLPAGLGDGQPVTAGAGVDLPHYLDLLTRTASYSAVYRTQPWIAAAVNKLALSTARLPLKTYRRTDTGREDAAETPLGRLLARPNRRDSAKFFWLWTVSTFELYGEAIWVKSRPGPGRAPTALWPMHPANVRTYYDDRGSVIYQYLPEPTGAYWPAEDVVHFRSYNPDDQLRGLSRLEPLRSSLISEDAVRKANESWWLNGARPSVVLQHPATIGDAPQRRIKESWERLHSGVQNWGKAAILEEGMT